MITNSVKFFSTEKVPAVSSDHELILAAWEVGNPENIGQIIRIAHNVGAKKVVFISKRENHRISRIKKTAGFSYEQMPREIISEDDFYNLIKTEFSLTVLETCDGAQNIFNQELPAKTILLAGNESHGLPPKIIEKCDLKVYIPMPGDCKSMNISHALTVGAFEWYRQTLEKE